MHQLIAHGRPAQVRRRSRAARTGARRRCRPRSSPRRRIPPERQSRRSWPRRSRARRVPGSTSGPCRARGVPDVASRARSVVADRPPTSGRSSGRRPSRGARRRRWPSWRRSAGCSQASDAWLVPRHGRRLRQGGLRSARHGAHRGRRAGRRLELRRCAGAAPAREHRAASSRARWPCSAGCGVAALRAQPRAGGLGRSTSRPSSAPPTRPPSVRLETWWSVLLEQMWDGLL